MAVWLLLFVQPLAAFADTGPVQRLGNGIPTSIAASPDGKTIAVGSSIGVWFFDAATFTPTRFWDTGTWVKAVQYSVDGRYLRADDKVYDSANHGSTQVDLQAITWRNHRCTVNGKLCAKDYYNDDAQVTTWIVNTSTLVAEKLVPPAQVSEDFFGYGGYWTIDLSALATDVAWSPDSKMLYTVNDKSVRALEVQTMQEKRIIGEFFSGGLPLFPTSLPGRIMWSADGTQLASRQFIWNAYDGSTVRPRQCPTSFNCEVPSIEVISSHKVYVLDITSGNIILGIEPHPVGTVSTALSGDKRLLATSGEDNAFYDDSTRTSTRIWDVQTGKKMAELPTLMYNLAFSPDGNLVAGHSQQDLAVWDWRTAQKLWSVPEDIGTPCDINYVVNSDFCQRLVGGVAINRSGEYIASYAASTNNVVHLRRLSTGELVTDLAGHTGAITGAAFSPDGTRLAADSFDGTTLIWPVP
jgi:WD40 repeat protein